MSELLHQVDKEIQSTAQMTRYRALETMDKRKYNPVDRLIDIVDYLKNQDLRDTDLEIKVHMKLLEYFSAAPKKQMSLDVNNQAQIVIMPASYADRYEGKDLTPCAPRMVDVTPIRTAMQELMGDTETYPDPEPR